MNIKEISRYHIISLILLSLVSSITLAETRIAILEFELKDLTLAPRIPSEIERTASIKPLLEAELKITNTLNISPINGRDISHPIVNF